LVRRTVFDVDHAAVGFPAGDARRESLIGIRDAAVMLLAVLIFFGIGGGIAAQPELLDELLALLVGLQPPERLALLIGDDIADFLVHPLFIRSLQLFAQPGFLLLSLLFSHRLGDGFLLLAGILGFVLFRLRQSGNLGGESRD